MKQINRVQTKEAIAKAIRQEILSGRMQAGEEITQEYLAETMGVSRMPVREALQTLEQEGFLVRLPNRHMQVVTLDKKNIAGIFCTIAAMEAEMLRQILDEGKDLKPLEDKLTKGIEFHFALANLLGNEYIKQVHSKLISGYVAYAMENMKDKEMSVSALHKVLTAAKNKNELQMNKKIKDYYKIYTKIFTAGR